MSKLGTPWPQNRLALFPRVTSQAARQRVLRRVKYAAKSGRCGECLTAWHCGSRLTPKDIECVAGEVFAQMNHDGIRAEWHARTNSGRGRGYVQLTTPVPAL
jgi:hypothetical protein